MNAPDHSLGMQPLLSSLLARAPQMNFFQLCQLLERLDPERAGFGMRDTPVDEPVRFRPFPKMGFPSAEIAGVEFDTTFPERPPSVRTTFLGLYGVNAMMPPHLIDDIVLRREGHEEVMAFLDLFNHRIATLFYRAWHKYRYQAEFKPGARDGISHNLLCLAGFGLGDKAKVAKLQPARVLGLLGLLTQKTRTAEGLAGVVAIAVPGAGIKVDERFPTWIHLEAPSSLGSEKADQRALNAGLGCGQVLGRRVISRSEAVRLTLRPVTAEQANALLPGASLHCDLLGLLRAYLGNKVDVVIRMEISMALAPVISLGKSRNKNSAESSAARLGWTTLLKPTSDRVITISLGRYEAIPVIANTQQHAA